MAGYLANAAQRIMMCRPTHFQINYSINPWMSIGRKVDANIANKQWENLKKTLEKCGGVVEVMEPENAEHFPDLVFSANSAVIRGKRAYLANFYYPERQGERVFFQKWFEEHGFETVFNADISHEGAGDALWGGIENRVLFCGVGFRSDVRALSDIEQKLYMNEDPFQVMGCRLIDPRFYHLDTCFCPLDEGLALWYREAFAKVTQHNMQNEMEMIDVPEEEALQFACNSVVIGRNVIMQEGNKKTTKLLKEVGYTVHEVDMSEFIKSGGSAKCCTIKLD